ncbi:IS66 family transposase [Piscirickettsia salmonis]|uniref:IS66 family transposase n=1 Tax=Piscirickettsia salmonis TaxID=1238 RepID=UPI003EBC3086
MEAELTKDQIIDQLTKKYALLEEQYELLRAQNDSLKRALFGRRSERFIDGDYPQLDLFNSDTQNVDTAEDSSNDNVVSIKSYKRKKKRAEILAGLACREQIIPVADNDRRCHCGREKCFIRYESNEKLDFKPAVCERVIIKREIVACPHGCDKSICIAAAPKVALPKVRATDELIAHLIVSKIEDRQPLYHLEKKLNQLISRQVMANWFIKAAHVLQPLVNLMLDEVIDHNVAGLDATSLQVLNEPERNAETKSYMYCLLGGAKGKEVILYFYNALENALFLKKLLDGFTGTIHGDAAPCYQSFDKSKITMSYCNAHARRKFEPIAKANKTPGLARKVMGIYRQLYIIENHAKKQQMTAEQRYQLRQEKSKPLMDELHALLIEAAPLIPPTLPLYEAVMYTLNQWTGLYRFIDNGHLEIDNNLTEQEIKPFVIGRKNFMFSCSVSGANALGVHFGLIRTANKHELDPYQYYVHILKKIPHCTSVEDYEALLPWNVKGVVPSRMEMAA